MHEVDTYDFNPDAHDIATNVADAENGRFERLGWAREFLTKATVSRTETFRVGIGPLANPRTPPSDLNVRA